jgi:hypothetical protein
MATTWHAASKGQGGSEEEEDEDEEEGKKKRRRSEEEERRRRKDQGIEQSGVYLLAIAMLIGSEMDAVHIDKEDRHL